MMLPKIRKMGNVLHDNLVGQEGEAAIVGFDHRIELLQDFTPDADLINAAVEKLKPGGQNSRLNDAVQFALAHAEEQARPAQGDPAYLGNDGSLQQNKGEGSHYFNCSC